MDKVFPDYTNAKSEAQAGHYLRRRYPYPKYIVEDIIMDPVTPVPKKVAPVTKQPLLEGKTYRVDIGNWGIPKGATAADVVRFEEAELGNKYGLSDSLLKELDNYSQGDTVWVTKKRVDAEVYLSEGMTKKDISEVTLPKGSRIIAKDGQGGYLVLRGDAEPKAEAMKNPNVELFFPKIDELCNLFPEKVDDPEEFSKRSCRAALTTNVKSILTGTHDCNYADLLLNMKKLGLLSQTISDRLPSEDVLRGLDTLKSLWDKLDDAIIDVLISDCSCAGKEVKHGNGRLR